MSGPNSPTTPWVAGGSARNTTGTPNTWCGRSPSEVRYIYDGRRVIQERDGNNNVRVSYTRGTDLSGTFEGAAGIGGLLARTEAGSHAYYFGDGMDNIIMMLDTNENVVAEYRYDPFGRLLESSGPLAQDNLYRFSSKEFHTRSGLYYYLYRYYDPVTQRWINRDPIGEVGGLNPYVFVDNNAIYFIDPYGLYTFGECLQICGAFCEGLGEGFFDTINPLPVIKENQDRLADAFVDGDPWVISGAVSAAAGHSILTFSLLVGPQ